MRKDKEIQKIDKTCKKRNNILAVTLSSILFINGVSSAYKLSREKSNEISNSSYNQETLYNSININPNLTDEEKDIIYNISDFVDDYYEFIDYDNACYQLQNFDIEYKPQEKADIATAGDWDYISHYMRFYIIDDSQYSLKNNTVAKHELVHLISVNGDFFPLALEEGIDSLICAEYDQEYDAYYKQRIITMMLCEIIDPEIIIESYLQKDFNIIKEELLKIDDDKSKIKKLEKLLEKYQEAFNKNTKTVGKSLNKLEHKIINKKIDEENEILAEINNILCDYYKTKTNKKIGNPVELHMFYPNEYISVFEEYDGTNYIKDNYSIIFSIYSNSLLDNNYKNEINKITFTVGEDFKTGYFKKAYDSNYIIISDNLIINTEKNNAKSLKKQINK